MSSHRPRARQPLPVAGFDPRRGRRIDLRQPAPEDRLAVGVREFAAHLAGETSLDAAMEATRQATRNYAKRQLTWFRNQTPDWTRID